MFVGIGVGVGRQRFAGGFVDSYSSRVLADGGTIESLTCVANASTLLQQASLLFIPSGYKAGVAYSALPNNGNGDLTWSRNSTANRTQSNGNIGSVGANVPRLSYMYGSCPALLLEPQRTNLALYSQDFDNATGWTILSTRFTFNKVNAPNNNNEAFEFVEVSATDTHNVFAASSNRPTSTSGATYTASAFFKQGTRRYCGISVGSGGSGVHVFLDTTNWTITDAKRFSTNTNWVYLSSNIQSVGNGWYRLSLTFRTDSALALIASIFASNVSTSTLSEPSYLGNGSTIITFGLQLEVGAYATTYIPTTTATATRLADTFTRNNIYTNGLIGASGGTWFVELKNNVAYIRDGASGLYLGTQNTPTLGDAISFRITTTSQQRLRIAYTSGSGSGSYSTISDNLKVAIKWNGTTMDVFENGIKVLNAVAFSGISMQNLDFGQGVPVFIQTMALYNAPLSDANCITLTT